MKLFPVNCANNPAKPYKIGKIGLDDASNPVLHLWCKRCSDEHACRLEQMLASWRQMLEGNEQAICSQIARLKKAIRDLEADLEDIQETKEKI